MFGQCDVGRSFMDLQGRARKGLRMKRSYDESGLISQSNPSGPGNLNLKLEA